MRHPSWRAVIAVSLGAGLAGTVALAASASAATGQPVASFTYHVSPNIPTHLGVDGSGSTGTIVDYTWQWSASGGKLDSGTNPKANHYYAHSGTYGVTLTVTDNTGATDSVTQQMPVGVSSGSGGHSTLVFFFENHSRSQVMCTGSTCMPYLNSLGQKYGQDTAYVNTGSPSEPNYLSVWGGSTFGIHDDLPPANHHISGKSVGDQAIALGKTAKAYEESMPTNCKLSSYNSSYYPKHNPWTFFSDTTPRANCNKFDVPMGSTSSGALVNAAANGNLPNVGYVTPNICHDAHNCPLSTANGWLKAILPKLLAGPQFKAGNLTVIITFDESNVDGAGHNIPFVVVDPRLSGKTISFAANHYSLCRWLEDSVGAPYLHNAATAPNLKKAFGL